MPEICTKCKEPIQENAPRYNLPDGDLCVSCYEKIYPVKFKRER